MTRIAITTSTFDVARLPAPLAACDLVTNPHGRRLTEDEAAALLDDGVVGLIAGTEPLTDQVLGRANALRAIARVGTGLDNVDLAAAARRGIDVVSTPDAPVDAVAELTVGLILDALRSIAPADRAVRRGEWPRLQGRLLRSRTVGVVGAGRIGREVARLLAALGARVLVHDPVVDEVPPATEQVDLEQLIVASDVVTLHLPLTDATRHVVDAHWLSRMRPGSILVNVARGGLVDEAALADALATGHLAAAALDTFEREPYVGPLTAMDQVVLTSHLGSSTVETRDRMEREAAAALLAALERAGVDLRA